MNNNTIRVGILHSLTGTMALSEKPLIDATLMAIAQINDRGGVLGMPIEPVIEDGASDPAIFREKAEKLLHQEQVATVFGCWTSVSRKAVKPVFEQYNGLLWYPVQYEGLEQSPNIFYTGSCPNQQVTPAVDWLLAQNRTRFYLIGSDYVFPRTINKIVKGEFHQYSGTTVGEAYASLGETDFHAIIQDIQRCQPDVVFSTLNGDSNLAFYQQYQAAGITADDIPIMAVSVSEVELQRLKDLAVGHFASWSYFQSLDTAKNREFVQAFQQRYGSDRVTSDPIEAAYSQVFLWSQAVSLAKSVEVEPVREAAYGQTFEAPGGWVRLESNHHLGKENYIGKILPNGQFEIVASSDALIKPLPWLGVEEQTFANAKVAIDLLKEVSQGIQYSWELEQQSKALDRRNREMAQYIEQVRQIADAAAAVEQEQFDPAMLAEVIARDDDLGQLARVFTRMVQTVKTRERELAEAKEQLEAVLNAVPGSISWVNSGGVYIGVNRHLAENFNLAQDAFIGQEVGFLKGSHKLADFLTQFVSSPDTSAQAVIDIGLDRARRYYLVVAQKYQQGSATVSVGIDITDRQLAEEALQQSEARNRAILNAIPDLILRFRQDGTYLDVVEAKGVGTIATSQNRIGKNVDDVLPQELANRYRHHIHKAIESGETQEFEYQLQIGERLSNYEGRVVRSGAEEAILIVRDITERKQAEEALRQSEVTNRALIDAIPDLLLRARGDGTYIADAVGATRLKRFAGGNPVLNNTSVFDSLPPEQATQRMDAIALALQTKTLQVYEQQLTIDDQVIDEEVRVVVTGEDEVLVMVRDISDRKQNEKLREENLRMGAELNVAQQIQQMILPKPEELAEIEGLDIAGYMAAADEVGGDYYDVLQADGIVTLGIGDVTGHGLESGLLMLMTQTAVRTLKEVREYDPVKFLDTLNRTIYKNVQRMNSEKNLTLAILNYASGLLSISGQHEETLVVRKSGAVERVDTIELGMPIGLDEDIADLISHTTVELQPGDGVVLYTDGIPEARDIDKKFYGLERLCEVVSSHWHLDAEQIKQAVIEDLRRFIGEQKVFDDITLLVLKHED